jgi:serine/threonine protein kinase
VITFACACGKKLQIIDGNAGKKVKCPGCGAISPAPQLQQPTVSFPDARSLPSGEDETLTKRPTNDDDPPSHEFLRPAQSAGELGRLGHFRILKELGHGGMGAVYLAEDVRLLRKVALKVMLPKFASHAKSKERFLREARTAASIENDHIITIHEVDEDNGIPFLTMPVLKGESLQDRLHRDLSLPAGEVLRIGWQICQGLQAAHERDLVHRDLKPGNLWLEGVRGRVKILDFGLARAVHTDQQLTQSGAIVGTPAYMAPEQARNPNVDGRADLFSLGIVLYRCLVGHAPFMGHDAMSVMLAICNDQPAPPDEQISSIPVELSNLIMKLLQKDPDRRFASAEEVGFALEAIDRKYFLGQAIPGSSLPPVAMQSIPMAQPITMPTIAPAAGTTDVPKQQSAPNSNPFAIPDKPVEPPQILPSPLRGRGAGGEGAALASAPSRRLPKKAILLLVGLLFLALLPILSWQIVIRLTDEKGNVRDILVKPGEKIEILQNPKKPEPIPADLHRKFRVGIETGKWMSGLRGHRGLDQQGRNASPGRATLHWSRTQSCEFRGPAGARRNLAQAASAGERSRDTSGWFKVGR